MELNVERFSIIILLIFEWLIPSANSKLRLSLPLHSRRLCPDNVTCDDGTTHFICKPKSSKVLCDEFENLYLTSEEKKYFIQGHNGIRNKVAVDFNIANMNLLYWNRDLQLLAKRWIYECKIEKTACNVIGKDGISVNMNYSLRSIHVFTGWAGRVVRTWYLELGVVLTDWSNYLANYVKSPEKLSNFTQMIWPLTEFVGCDIGRIGNGLFVVCFYEPPYKPEVLSNYPDSDEDEDFILGRPCSMCVERTSCSTVFPHLCGADFKNIIQNYYIDASCENNLSIMSSEEEYFNSLLPQEDSTYNKLSGRAARIKVNWISALYSYLFVLIFLQIFI